MYPFSTEFYRKNCTVNTHNLSYRNQPHREIIAVCSEHSTKHFCAPCGQKQNVIVLNLVVWVLTTDYCNLMYVCQTTIEWKPGVKRPGRVAELSPPI
jgi:hypothetical protein